MATPSNSDAGGVPVQVELSVSVLVSDPGALRDYVRRRYAACWFDGEWAPADLAEAVLEALVLSNENPTPVDYGIEIIESRAGEVSPEVGGRRRGPAVDPSPQGKRRALGRVEERGAVVGASLRPRLHRRIGARVDLSLFLPFFEHSFSTTRA